jgi:small-conductance mechanosensitive channel
MLTTTWWQDMLQMISNDQIGVFIRVLIIVGVGLFLARLVNRILFRAFRASLNPHQMMLIRLGSYYLLLILFALWVLQELGLNPGILLGTAGILTVAIGFASQTSMSNLISGFFLIGEKPFAVGDIIRVGDTTGEVLAIDSLSVKLRTFDNIYVRIPNELIIKSQVMTLTRFPIRRIDLQIGVAYKEDMNRVRQVVFEVADKNPLALEEPQPLFIFQGFGDSALEMQFSVWVRREEYLSLRNSIQEEIKSAFDKEGIEIPFPHRSLYTGSVTRPFPVQIVSG